MKGIGFIGVFYTKVVNTEDKADGPCFVAPKARGVGTFVIPMFGKALSKELVGKNSSLWKAVHAFSDFGVDESVVEFFVELIFFLNLDWYVINVKSYIFVFGEGSSQVEIVNIHAHVFRVWVGNGAVEVDFCSCKIGSPRADVAGEVDEIAAYGESGSVGL